MSVQNIKKNVVIAELVGTFSLAFAVLVSLEGLIPGIPTPVVAALALGLAVLTIGKVSGAHINPAVTIGLWTVQKINTTTALAYIVAQVTGALLALVTLSLFLEGSLDSSITVPITSDNFFGEALGMSIFGFGIAAAVHNAYSDITASFVVGGSLLLGIIFASIASSGVLNPAVAISVSSLSGAYVLGPIVGSIVGMNIYALALTKKGKL